ncbi:hypothetical protein M0802_005948 [Mischocyttarus mexicanus]|nr:hypothetical protein M0802_005948 [Mischocyttarus mexicanus]
MAAVELAAMHRENPAVRVTAVPDDDEEEEEEDDDDDDEEEEDQYHLKVTAVKVNVDVSSFAMKTRRPVVPSNKAIRRQRTPENCKGKLCPGHRPCPPQA